MHQPLHIFIGTVYPRYAEMTAERLRRLHCHNTRITMLHEHLLRQNGCIITNPLNDPARRVSDTFPTVNVSNVPVMTTELKTMLEAERLQETMRRDLQCLRNANVAIIDLTYLESGNEIKTMINEARLLDIPYLLTREGTGGRGINTSVLNKRCYLASYSSDEEFLLCVDLALDTIFSYSKREDETDPQIPSRILQFSKRA